VKNSTHIFTFGFICLLQNKLGIVIVYLWYKWGHVVAQLVEALRYKPVDRGFDSRWCPSDRTMALGLTQPLTEMRARNISLGVGVKAASA